jgi:hypothetical protein
VNRAFGYALSSQEYWTLQSLELYNSWVWLPWEWAWNFTSKTSMSEEQRCKGVYGRDKRVRTKQAEFFPVREETRWSFYRRGTIVITAYLEKYKLLQSELYKWRRDSCKAAAKDLQCLVKAGLCVEAEPDSWTCNLATAQSLVLKRTPCLL